jgi:hypothetical protein
MNPSYIILTALASFSIASYCQASDDNNLYIGLKAGQANFKEPLTINQNKVLARDGTSKTLVAGYNLTKNYSIELQYTKIDTDTDIVNYCGLSCRQIRGDVSVDTYAVYGAYRSNGNIYFTAKAGYLYEEAELSFLNRSYDTKYGREFTLSLGVGMKIDSFNIEIDYTSLESDIYLVNLGANYHF